MTAIAKTCVGCGAVIPDARRADSKYCSPSCRTQFRAAYFTARGTDFPPGKYLLFLRAPISGLIMACQTGALRTRIRTAQASCAETLVLMGIIPADRAQADWFRERFVASRVRGSWYKSTPELRDYIRLRARWAGPPQRFCSLNPDLAVDYGDDDSQPDDAARCWQEPVPILIPDRPATIEGGVEGEAGCSGDRRP
jgi:hypothetical protein